MTLRKLTHARLGSHDVADAYVTSNAQAFGKPPGGERPAAGARPFANGSGLSNDRAYRHKNLSTVSLSLAGERPHPSDRFASSNAVQYADAGSATIVSPRRTEKYSEMVEKTAIPMGSKQGAMSDVFLRQDMYVTSNGASMRAVPAPMRPKGATRHGAAGGGYANESKVNLGKNIAAGLAAPVETRSNAAATLTWPEPSGGPWRRADLCHKNTSTHFHLSLGIAPAPQGRQLDDFGRDAGGASRLAANRAPNYIAREPAGGAVHYATTSQSAAAGAARSPRVVPKGKGGFAAESQKSTVPIDQVGERSDTADWRTLASASFTGARGEASKPFPQKGTLGAWLDGENSPRKSIL